MIKFGILGLGRVVEKRVFSVFSKELKGGKVVAVFDKNKKKNKKFALLFDCKLAKNLKDFFSKKLDIIYVATESGNHFKNINDCFKFNKNVIVEKPPVLKLKQLYKLNKTAKKPIRIRPKKNSNIFISLNKLLLESNKKINNFP